MQLAFCQGLNFLTFLIVLVLTLCKVLFLSVALYPTQEFISKTVYYIAGSASGQDEVDPVF